MSSRTLYSASTTCCPYHLRCLAEWPQPGILARKPAINAFIRVNDEHVLALIEAIDRANLDTIHVFALDAGIDDNIGHGQGHS